MKRYKITQLLCLVTLMCTSCKTLEFSDRSFLNDPDMRLGVDASGEFQNYIYKIREGATPAGTKKTSGGCGCN